MNGVKKNIALITSEFPPEPGGIGNHAYNLAKNLKSKGYFVQVIADQRSFDSSKEKSFDNELSFSVKRIKIKRLRFLMYFARILAVYKATRQNEVVMASGKFSLWLVAIMSFIFKREFIAIIHGSEVNFKKRWLKISINLSLKRFSKIVAVSNYTKKLVKHLNLKNIKVIPNGFVPIERNSLSKNKVISKNINLITVGSITERKGQLNVIEGIPELLKKNPNIHYHIVGKPYIKETLIKRAQELSITKHLTFYGVVSDAEKQQLFEKSDIFVMLSNETPSGSVEGFGIAILEANSMNLPAIGAKGCGIEDAIDQNKSGILINHKNHKAFSEAVSTIVVNYKMYQKNAYNWSKNFTWDKIIMKYIIYLEL